MNLPTASIACVRYLRDMRSKSVAAASRSGIVASTTAVRPTSDDACFTDARLAFDHSSIQDFIHVVVPVLLYQQPELDKASLLHLPALIYY